MIKGMMKSMLLVAVGIVLSVTGILVLPFLRGWNLAMVAIAVALVLLSTWSEWRNVRDRAIALDHLRELSDMQIRLLSEYNETLDRKMNSVEHIRGRVRKAYPGGHESLMRVVRRTAEAGVQ